MNLYFRNLKRIGILMTVIAAANLVYELLLRRYLVDAGSAYVSSIPLPWGIWTKGAIGVAAGLTALFFYVRKLRRTAGTWILCGCCLAEVMVIILSTTGSVARRTNGFFDITMLIMILLTYTLSQTNRDVRRLEAVRARQAVMLDLRLKDLDDFFNPIQIGPKMAINPDYAAVISRFISSMQNPAPLQINLFCSGRVSESMRGTMREVLVMHYETEETRIVKDLEMRYRRIMLLTFFSVFVIGVIQQTSILSEGMVVAEIIANFAAFGLWQIGYTHYERDTGYEALLTVHIAKYAELDFVER